ncbi:MAG: GAF domain-containing protein, partial [Nitriliruptor sp.]
AANRVAGVEEREDYGGGVSRHALETGRTVVSPDYRNDELRLPGLDLGAVVATPIRADGRDIGVLTAGVPDAGAPPMGDVEVVEVLAAHLGGALALERVEDNQAVLLSRLRDLDRLRANFVDRVSEDLRDPLTVVRGVAQTLVKHGERVPVEQRAEMLARLTAQASELARTLETLLDFSRVQVGKVDPRPEPIDLVELLAEPLAGTGLELNVRGRPVVVVDRDLVRRAVEILLRGPVTADVGLIVGEADATVSIDVGFRATDGLEASFAMSLAEQLLVAGGATSERLPGGFRLVLPLRRSPVTQP